MTVLRKPHFLYFHGLLVDLKKDDIYRWLVKYFPEFKIDRIQFSSDPKKDIPIFKRVKFDKYIATIGHSMGGLYSQCVSGKPSFLINPGFGISRRESKNGIDFSGFKELEDHRRPDPENVYGFFGKKDSKLWLIEPEYIKKFGKQNITYFPGSHVPTELDIKNIIVPGIKNILN